MAFMTRAPHSESLVAAIVLAITSGQGWLYERFKPCIHGCRMAVEQRGLDDLWSGTSELISASSLILISCRRCRRDARGEVHAARGKPASISSFPTLFPWRPPVIRETSPTENGSSCMAVSERWEMPSHRACFGNGPKPESIGSNASNTIPAHCVACMLQLKRLCGVDIWLI